MLQRILIFYRLQVLSLASTFYKMAVVAVWADMLIILK